MQNKNKENEIEYMIEDEHSIKEEDVPCIEDTLKVIENIKSHCDKIVELCK